MRKVLLLATGAAFGYVLGARAGRPAYDRIAARWSDLANAVGVREVAATVKEAGVDVRDSAVSRATAAVSAGADDVAARIHPEPHGDESTEPVVTSVGPESGGY